MKNEIEFELGTMSEASLILDRLKNKKKGLKKNIKENSYINWYLDSYEHFIDYFKKLDKITEKDVIFGISMTYSWMPTNPKVKIKTELEQKDLELFNNIKRNKDKNSEIKSIERIKKLFNCESLISISKLIHFLNPNKYPIWDTKIIKYLNNEFEQFEKNKLSNKSIDDYLFFKKFCDKLKNSEEYKKIEKVFFEIYKEHKEKVNSYSKCRIIEQCLWLLAHWIREDEKK